MTPWEQTVRDQLASDGAVDLDSIGGVPSIPADAVASPLFPAVAAAVVASFETLGDDDRRDGVHLMCEAVAASSSGLAFRSLTDVLVPAAPALGATDTLKDSLRQRVNDRADEPRSALAATALKALCHLALLEDGARYILFDALGTIGSGPEHDVFATAAAWVAGVTFDRWRESAASECLQRLTTGEGEADASFWLGQALLVSALELDDTDSIRSALRGTLEHFDRAAEMGEDRPDAVMYGATVRFITDYAADADKTRLAEHLNAATTACHHYLVDGLGLPELPPWMRPRYDAEARWVELLRRLQAATNAEDRGAWFGAPQLIDGLADAYSAAHTLRPTRSYLPPDAPPTTITEAVVPRISSSFIDDLVPLAYLDQWLDQSEHPDAAMFQEAVATCVAAGVNRGKVPAVGDYPAVKRHLGSIPEDSDPEFLAQVEHLLEDRDADKVARTDRVVSELINELHGGLEPCPDFTGEVRECFTVVVDQVVRFLHLRMNVQRGGVDGRFTYLYDANAHERLLGADLRDFISGNVGGTVHCEVQELAGGRTDLIVQFDGFRITIELKREKVDVTPEGLTSSYMPQLAAYESTDVTLGMLVVLDLTEKPTGAANIRDNAWVARLQGPNPGDRERFSVVVRVPGNRVAPSSL
jgi:hypothetical protein